MVNQNTIISLKVILKGSLVVLGGGAIGQFFNFIFKLIAARHFGPEDYGWFSLALALILVSGNISDLGMQQSIARFIPFFQEKNEKKKLNYAIKFGAKISIIASLILALLIIIGSSRISKSLNGGSDFTVLLISFAFVVPFVVAFNYLQGILRGMKDMRMMAISNNFFVWGPRLALLRLILILKADIESIVLAYYASYIIGVIAVWLYIKKKVLLFEEVEFFTPSYRDLVLSKQLIAYSLPLAFSGISNVLRQRFDVIFIGIFQNAFQVGLYNVALPLAMLMTVLLVAINRITLPVIAGLFRRESEKEMEHIYRLLAKWTLMITLPIFFLMLLFPEKVIYITFGERYVEAANALRFLSIGFFINAISGSFGEYLQSYSKTKSILIISVTGTGINIILMLLLIPQFGIEGAAIACTLSLVYISLLGNAFLYHYKRILPISKHYVYTFCIGTFFFLSMYFVHSYLFADLKNYNFLLFIVLSILIYIVLLYFFATDDFDKNIIGSAKTKTAKILLKEI